MNFYSSSRPPSSLGPVSQSPVAAAMTQAFKMPSQLGPTTQGPNINATMSASPMASFNKPTGSSLGGPGGYGMQSGVSAQVNEQPYGGLRRAMMEGRERPMMRRAGR